MKMILALYMASAKEFVRDRLAMFFTLLLPIAFALFFGALFGSGNQAYRLNLGLAVEDQGPTGGQLAAQLGKGGEMLVVTTGLRDELLATLGKGNLDVVMVLPDGLSSGLASGNPAAVPPVALYYDPSRRASAGTGLGIAQTLLSEVNLSISGAPRLLVAAPTTVQSQALSAADFFIPSLLGLSMLWLGLFATAQPLVQLREQKVLRRLGVTPLSRGRLLAGQVAWRVTMGVMQAALFLIVGRVVMGVQMTGSWPLFVAAVLLGALVFVSIGYFVAAISKTVEGAIAIAQIVNFPMMFLSGTFFEPGVLPDFLKPVQQILPLTYLNDALRQIMVGFTPLYPLGLDFAILGVWLAVFVMLSVRLFRWE